MEAEHRRREAVVIQSIGIENAGHVCMYVCFFKDFSRMRAPTEPKMVPYGRVVDNTLLRHVFSAVVIPERVWHMNKVPIGLTLWSGQWGRGMIFEF